MKMYVYSFGAWTDGEKIRAIREGISRDGRVLFPMMPYPNFRLMSDEDVYAVVAYMNTLPAVRNPLPPLKSIAMQVGFSEESFEACSKNKDVQNAVVAVGEGGSKMGVNSTPTIFINGKVYTGTHSIEEFEKAILALLKS